MAEATLASRSWAVQRREARGRRAGTTRQVGFQSPSTRCLGSGVAGVSQWGRRLVIPAFEDQVTQRWMEGPREIGHHGLFNRERSS